MLIMQNLGQILKHHGLRKMAFGFAMFLLNCGLVYAKAIPADIYSSVTMALVAGMFAGNVAEHLKKKEDKPE